MSGGELRSAAWASAIKLVQSSVMALVSISVARSGHLCAKLPAMPRNAPPPRAPPSRYATVLVPSQSFDWRQAATPVLGTDLRTIWSQHDMSASVRARQRASAA